MSTPDAVATTVTFVWLGMVSAISFLEAPLKFRAPGVTVQIGLGIGRLVFRALNATEVAFSVLIVAALVAGDPSTTAATALLIAVACLVVQLTGIRPRLTRRSDAVLAGHDVARSNLHLLYVGTEILKAGALLLGGAAVLAG